MTSARYRILHADHRIAQDEVRIAEYELDPEAFARKHYGAQGVDSYPVQTNIGRRRESLLYRSGRRELRLDALQVADAALERVQRSVLEQVGAMRPSPGRIPWPKPLMSFEAYKLSVSAQRERDHRAQEARLVREKLLNERQEASENEVRERRRRVRQEELAIEWNLMNLEDRAAFDRGVAAMRECLTSGLVSMDWVLNKLRELG
ncbi:MAG: hypothetical protein ACRYG8_10260 [Janthinobacterium lividum]